MHVVFSAEAPTFATRAVLVVHQVEGDARKAPVDAAHDRPVAGSLRRLAELHFADLFGVISHDREIQRAVELERALRHAVGVPGLNGERRTLGKGVRLSRSRSRALGTGILAVARVHVGIAEVGASQRIVLGAGFAFLGTNEVRLRGIRGPRQEGEEGQHGREREHGVSDRCGGGACWPGGGG